MKSYLSKSLVKLWEYIINNIAPKKLSKINDEIIIDTQNQAPVSMLNAITIETIGKINANNKYIVAIKISFWVFVLSLLPILIIPGSINPLIILTAKDIKTVLISSTSIIFHFSLITLNFSILKLKKIDVKNLKFQKSIKNEQYKLTAE